MNWPLPAVDVVGFWIGVFLTFCILSYLYKDNPFYKLAEHLFVYAVGRPATLSDRPALDAAVAAARAEDWRFSALVRGIARAPAFTHRRRARASLELDDDDGPGR